MNSFNLSDKEKAKVTRGIVGGLNILSTLSKVHSNSKKHTPQYKEQNQEQNQAMPTAESPVNTGTGSGLGIGSALGTQYSWQQQAVDHAKITYGKDREEAFSQALGSRRSIESSINEANKNATLNKYASNQVVDKVGWAGGAALDADRQTQYLKASIQADMYGQMELQRAGYDSLLAQARLAFDENQVKLAHDYWKSAIEAAAMEASVTGKWFAPEVKDMLQQRNVANDILQSAEPGSDEYLRAQKIIENVNGWFADNNLSETGVKGLALMQAEAELKRMKFEEMLMNQSLVESVTRISNDARAAGMIPIPVYDDDGRVVSYKSISPTSDAARKFFAEDEKGLLELENYLSTLEDKQAWEMYKTLAPKDEDGKLIPVGRFTEEGITASTNDDGETGDEAGSTKPDGMYTFTGSRDRYYLMDGDRYQVAFSKVVSRKEHEGFTQGLNLTGDSNLYYKKGNDVWFIMGTEKQRLLTDYLAKTQDVKEGSLKNSVYKPGTGEGLATRNWATSALKYTFQGTEYNVGKRAVTNKTVREMLHDLNLEEGQLYLKNGIIYTKYEDSYLTLTSRELGNALETALGSKE